MLSSGRGLYSHSNFTAFAKKKKGVLCLTNERCSETFEGTVAGSDRVRSAWHQRFKDKKDSD